MTAVALHTAERAAELALAVTVELLGPGLDSTWDAMVADHPDGTVFHLCGWRRAVERGFGHRASYLVARRGATLAGLLPLFKVPRLRGGPALVSVPYGIRGGVVADDAAAAASLLASARTHAAEVGATTLELRTACDRWDLLPARAGYITFRADLREDESSLLRRMDRKRRQNLAHAMRGGHAHRVAPLSELSSFYRLFAMSMRRHGTPVYPRRFIDAVAHALPEAVSLHLLEERGAPIMAVLALGWRGVLIPLWAGRSDPRRRGGEELIYWLLMRWARDQGFHTFDFGRSRRDTGAAAFKRRWGMEEVPLDYGLASLDGLERRTIDPGNPRLRPLIAMWRRLPLPLARVIGPAVARRLG